jgi:membrane protein
MREASPPSPTSTTGSSPRRGRARRSRWRYLRAIAKGFFGQSLGVRAGNLTFITTTSLVPLTALILSLVHVMNAARVERLVLTFFDDIFAPAGKSAMVDGFRRFLHVAPTRTIGGVSLLLLLLSSSALLRHLDAALNGVWAVRRRRSLPVSIGLYVGMLTLGPALMGATLVGTDGLRRLVLWLEVPFQTQTLRVLTMAFAGAAFTLLYKMVPNAPVRWRSALIGGGVSGVAWYTARHVYGGVASLFYASSPLYGSIGIAPLFLMWIYVSWVIVLTGARLAYAIEHAGFRQEFETLFEHPRSHELVATRVVAIVSRASLDGRIGPSPRDLAAWLGLPEQRLRDVVHQLEDAGLLIVGPRNALAPAGDPLTLTLADVSAAVGGTLPDEEAIEGTRDGRFRAPAALFAQVDELVAQRLRTVTWQQLAEQEPALPPTT